MVCYSLQYISSIQTHQLSHYCLICCRCAHQATGQAITEVTTGAIIAHKEPVREIKGYAKVFISLTEDHRLDDQWANICDNLAATIRSRFPTNVNTMLEFRAILLTRVDTLRRRISRTQRARRGLFNFIGDIGSALFGIPSASDIHALAEANKQLADEVEGVIVTQQKVVAKVNLLGRQQQQLVGKVNAIIDHQRNQDINIKMVFQAASALQFLVEFNQDALRLEFLIEMISDHITQYEEALAQIQAVRVACEARIVTEQVLPVQMVTQILSQGNNRVKINPIEYYAYIQVKKITTIDDEVYCVLRAPMFSDSMQYEITIRTFPKCYDGKCLEIYQPPPFIIDYGTEELYFPDECTGPIPKACRPGVIYDKTHQPCLHGLINHDPQQQAECPLTYYSKPPPPGDITTATLNRYLVTTEKTLYHYRCPRETPIVGRLIAGHYLIDVEPYCIVDSGQWMIRGLPTFVTNYSTEVILPQPIPLDWFILPNHTHLTLDPHLPPGQSKMSIPNYETLIRPPGTDIVNRIDEIQATIGKNPLKWWMWLIIVTAALMALFLGFIYFRKTLCPKKLNKQPIVTEPQVRYDSQKEQVTVEHGDIGNTSDT